MIVYVYSSICTVFQMLIAFRFYQTLTIPKVSHDLTSFLPKTVQNCLKAAILIHFLCMHAIKDDKEHVDAEDLLPITKIWIIGSYVLLFNWALKAGIYAQHCKCGLSVALAIYLAEMAFRFAAICIGNTFLKKLERAITERRSQIKLQAIVTAYKARKFNIENV